MTRSRSRIQPGDGDDRHGTTNGYGNLGCRCTECRRAHADAVKARKYQRISRPIPDHVHGTASAYDNYRCRCQPCIDAHNERARANYHRKHSAAARGSTWGILCKHKHPLSGDNLYIRPDNGRKQCKTCAREITRRQREKRLAAAQ